MPMHTEYKMAYLGPEGTFSFFTGQEYLREHLQESHATLVPCLDLADVFESVANGTCHLGMIPLENSLRGTVGPSFDLFLHHTLRIRGEAFARISNTLLSQEDSREHVRVVYSHAQPLAQCAGWLRQHLPGIPTVPLESTAAAALRASQEKGAAAIGHYKLAELYGLNTLANSIEDEADNWTRFVTVTLPESPWPPLADINEGAESRSSLLFTLPDQPGALARLLCLFAEYGVNMRKIESRPLGEKKYNGLSTQWKYAFFVDVECDLTQKAHAALLGAMAVSCTSLRLLGSYTAGPWLGIGNLSL